MFGLFGPPLAEFLGSEGQTIQFAIKKPLAVGKTVQIRLDVPVREKPGAVEKVNLTVGILSCRPNPAGAFVCAAKTALEEEQLNAIRLRYRDAPRPAQGGGAAVRRSRRYNTSIRVLSPELPGYRAVTVDFSMHGLQLEAEGPVENGKIINVTLELESSSTPQLNLDGKIVWCREKDRRKFLVGLEFVNIDAERAKGLQLYDQYLGAREKGDLQQRQLADADLFLMGRGND